MWRRLACWLIGLSLAVTLGSRTALVAQAPQLPTGAQSSGGASAMPALNAESDEETTTFVYFNRPIILLRARVLGRRPVERAATAERMLDDLVAQGISGPVELRPIVGGVLIAVASRGLIGVTPPDVDVMTGETVEGVAAQAVSRLRQALDEAAESRRPARLFRAFALALLGLIAGALALWGIIRARQALLARLIAAAERTVARSGIANLDVLRASRLLDFERAVTTFVFASAAFVVIYASTTFVLRQFPYTRPWGESMRGFLLATVENFGLAVAQAIPGLFTVLLIALIARFLIRLVRLWFDAVERGRVRAHWIYPETAQPTRRLLTGLLWLFAIVMAYPYLPGSRTEAFKGVTVFIGLMVTFGSSGLVNQIMSSFMITYSRALRAGDFVRIGDVEGTVSHLGVLSTKIKTPYGEDVTVPNAVVIAQTITDYSRFGETEGVFTPTSVTIGYDTPWRQVEALLVMAADRTPGLRRQPKPLVLQEALQDFYVKYTLLVCLERQESRPFTLDVLHATIQDVFNEYGVQIMSPNYVFDPVAPKVVARKDWFNAPARPDPPRSE